MATEAVSPQDNIELFKQLDLYPWDSDKEFQGGLQAILGSNPSPSQSQELTLRARCFYYARKKQIPVDFDAYKAWVSSNTLAPPPITSTSQPHHESDLPLTTSNAGEEPAPYPQTFSQIVALITSGQPIPGIKDIAPTVLEDKASQPVVSKRRKPWENEDVKVEGGVGTFGDGRDQYIKQEEP